MKLNIEPTDEFYSVPFENGTTLPVRIWRGTSEGGARVEAYVFSVVPHPDDFGAFQREVGDTLKRSGAIYNIDTSKP